MITLVPALAWGLSDRGIVRKGMAADINVFDPVRLMPELPVVKNDLPAGGRRPVSRSTGIGATIVAGQVVHRNGAHSGALSGRLLRTRRR